MTRPKQTAVEAYQDHRRDIATMIDWLEMELDRHAERAAAEPANWSLAGDLGEVRRRVLETLAFLSGHTEADIDENLAELPM